DVHLRVTDLNCRVLGEDRDALLALEIHRVHDSLRHFLIGAERTGLPEQGVDECRFAVVDVRDDRDVSQIVAARTGWSAGRHATHSNGGLGSALLGTSPGTLSRSPVGARLAPSKNPC